MSFQFRWHKIGCERYESFKADLINTCTTSDESYLQYGDGRSENKSIQVDDLEKSVENETERDK